MIRGKQILQRWLRNFGKNFGYTNDKMIAIRLIHWFMGEFYHSKALDRSYTLCWVIFNVINTVLYFYHCLSYLIFTNRPEFSNILYTSNALITGIYLMILLQLISYVYRKSTLEAFENLDRHDIFSDKLFTENDLSVLLQRQHFEPKKNNFTHVIIILIACQLGSMVCYEICTNLHLILGYTKTKLNDPNSYFYPVYCERVNSLGVFCIILCSQLIASSPLILVYLLMPSYVMIIVAEFHRKFQRICEAINNQSKLFAIRYEKCMAEDAAIGEINCRRWLIQECSFLRNIRSNVELHEKLLRAISRLKPYLEMNMSISIGIFMYLEIVLCYIFISINDDSTLLRIKNMNYAVIICTIFFVNCLTGKLFSDMDDMFREAIYDIPWYYLSPSNRKFVHLLQIRTHRKIVFKALNVYPMNMELFLKFYEHVYSVVNVLRHITP